MKYLLSALILLLLSGASYAAPDNTSSSADGETVLISFITKTKKTVTVSIAKYNSYIIYRFGTIDKRGGGAAYEGMDLNYLKFKNNEYTFTVFKEYYAAANEKSYGINIENGAKKFVIEGDPSTIIGTLISLRDNKKIKTVD